MTGTQGCNWASNGVDICGPPDRPHILVDFANDLCSSCLSGDTGDSIHGEESVAHGT